MKQPKHKKFRLIRPEKPSDYPEPYLTIQKEARKEVKKK